MEQISTKDRILDAAEQLFADRGFANTSLRQITAAAGANIASVNYYFQSKEALIRAVFSRRLVPINKRRLELLNQLEARGTPPSVEEVLRAFIEPVLCAPQGLQGFMTFGRLVGRMYSDPSDTLSRVFLEELAEVRVRFVAAIQRAMPELPLEELYWKLHFAIAVFAQTLTGLPRLRAISGGVCDISDGGAILERIVAFVSAGFRAPSVVSDAKGEPQCKGN
ncbi:MAG: TetR/AcrR family transcriptional regulator [Rhodospirillales bacterium]